MVFPYNRSTKESSVDWHLVIVFSSLQHSFPVSERKPSPGVEALLKEALSQRDTSVINLGSAQPCVSDPVPLFITFADCIMVILSLWHLILLAGHSWEILPEKVFQKKI